MRQLYEKLPILILEEIKQNTHYRISPPNYNDAGSLVVNGANEVLEVSVTGRVILAAPPPANREGTAIPAERRR